MELVSEGYDVKSITVVNLLDEQIRTGFRQQSAWAVMDGLLFAQREKEIPFRVYRAVFEDLGEMEKSGQKILVMSVRLYGEKSDFFPLQGKIDLVGFVGEKEYEYDVRYVYEEATDFLIERGIVTTVEEQKQLHYQSIAEACKERGLDLGEMCENTLKFIKES